MPAIRTLVTYWNEGRAEQISCVGHTLRDHYAFTTFQPAEVEGHFSYSDKDLQDVVVYRKALIPLGLCVGALLCVPPSVDSLRFVAFRHKAVRVVANTGTTIAHVPDVRHDLFVLLQAVRRYAALHSDHDPSLILHLGHLRPFRRV